MQEKLRKAELAIDRLQEHQRNLMPTITRLESDVAQAMARAAASASHGGGSAVNWVLDRFSRQEKLSKSTSALMDMEAGLPIKQTRRPAAPRGKSF